MVKTVEINEKEHEILLQKLQEELHKEPGREIFEEEIEIELQIRLDYGPNYRIPLKKPALAGAGQDAMELDPAIKEEHSNDEMAIL